MLDDGQIACGIFIDLEKAFDTVSHDILLEKLDHYGIRGISNDWFRSYLSDRSQFVSINGFNSDYKTIKYGILQGSFLGLLLFSVKQINKVVDKDLKFLVQWLNANRISLNVTITEVIIFRKKKKHLDCDLNLKFCRKKLKPSNYIRYLGIYLDEYLNLSPHINHLSQTLVKANAMLCKLWHFVNIATIKSIYYAIFHSHLSYVCTASGQNLNSKHRANLLQKKAMQIISFASFDAHTLPIFAKLNIIKFPDLISFCNCLFVYKHFLSKFPSVFSNVFILTFNTHEENTRSALHGLLTQPSCSTSKYGINAFCCFSYKIMELFFKKVF